MKRKPRYYAAIGRIPEDENYIAFGRSTDKAIAKLVDDLYEGRESLIEEIKQSYGQAIILEAVFSSESPIKLEPM